MRIVIPPFPPNSEEAMFCAFECTFCKKCVEEVLQNVCPNCGGGFEKRPILPKEYLEKYPPSEKVIHKPVNLEKFQPLLERNKILSLPIVEFSLETGYLKDTRFLATVNNFEPSIKNRA